MKNFDYGFSPKLAKFAQEHRPLSTSLSLEQIILLSSLAGYNLVDKPDGRFTIYHSDGSHGLDNGITVIWNVSVFGNELQYRPYAKSNFIRGNSSKVTDYMEEVISCYLRVLGFKEVIRVQLPESAVILPRELRHPGEYVFVMYVSECREKYRELYKFLKRIYGNP